MKEFMRQRMIGKEQEAVRSQPKFLSGAKDYKAVDIFGKWTIIRDGEYYPGCFKKEHNRP